MPAASESLLGCPGVAWLHWLPGVMIQTPRGLVRLGCIRVPQGVPEAHVTAAAASRLSLRDR
jgi:hypothetical protein